MKQVDMSPEAVARRLRQAGESRELSIALMKAKKMRDQKITNGESRNPSPGIRSSETDKETAR